MTLKFLPLLLAVSLLACKDDDPKPTAAEKQGVLLAGKKGEIKTWIVNEFTIDGDDVYPADLACFFDNEYVFSNNEDQTFDGNEGEENCFMDSDGNGEIDTELPDSIESGQWAFSIDGETLIVLSNNYNSPVALFSYFGSGSTPFPADVVVLTNTTLELRMNYTIQGDSGFITIKFVVKPVVA